MDWSRIKTIFIFSFLILDIFLLYWFIDKRDEEKIPVKSEATFAAQLEADEIQLTNLPKDVENEQFLLNAVPKEFNDEELVELKEQQIVVSEDRIEIQSEFNISIPLGEEFDQTFMETILAEKVLHGDQYTFWEYNKANRAIVYYQSHNKFTLFNNPYGRLIFFLNEDNEIIGYKQTMFSEFEEYGQQSIIPVMTAIEALHSRGKLKTGSTVTGASLGYYSLVQLPSQVLAPTWHITVNETESLFVNAIEGRVIEMEQTNTITE